MMKIELITWRDAGSSSIEDDNSWKSHDEVDDDNPIIESVGWLVKETDNNLTIALDYCTDDGTTNGRSRIPKGMVVTRKVLFERED